MATESESEARKFLGTAVPRNVVLILVIVLPALGFLIGSIGSLGGGTSTTEVKTTVTPNDIGLKPGKTGSVSVLVRNPNDHGVRVASIAASQSEAAGGCSAGALTSEELSNPAGYIGPDGVNGYPVTVTLKDNVSDDCLKQALTLPLTVELASARS